MSATITEAIPTMAEGIASILRNPNLTDLHADMVGSAPRRVLVQLCRTFGLPASGSMDILRQRLIQAATRLDRDEIARSAFYGVNGYEAVDAHMNTILGSEQGGLWLPATNASQADAIRVIDATPDDELRQLIPGGAFSTPYSALTPLFALGGRQYAEVSTGGTIVYRTQTGGFRFYCEGTTWLTSPAMREMRQHYHPTPTEG